MGLPNGDITLTRGLARLVPSQRWSCEAITAMKGTPSKPVLRPEQPAAPSATSPVGRVGPHDGLQGEGLVELTALKVRPNGERFLFCKGCSPNPLLDVMLALVLFIS